MAYDAKQLLAMSQSELDDLFRASPAGPIPNGVGRRHGDHRSGHHLQHGDRRRSSTTSAGRARSSTPKRACSRTASLSFGFEAIIAKVYKTPSWLDQQGVHRPRLLRDLARRPLHPRRDPSHRPGLLSRQGVLGQGSADRLLPAVLSMTPQDHFMVVAPVAAGKEPALRALLHSMNAEPGMADPSNAVVPFAQFERLHFARLVLLDDALQADLRVHGVEPHAPADLPRLHRRLRRPGRRGARRPGATRRARAGARLRALRRLRRRRRRARLDARAQAPVGGELRQLGRAQRAPDPRRERAAARAGGTRSAPLAGRAGRSRESATRARRLGRRRSRRRPAGADAGTRRRRSAGSSPSSPTWSACRWSASSRCRS